MSREDGGSAERGQQPEIPTNGAPRDARPHGLQSSDIDSEGLRQDDVARRQDGTRATESPQDPRRRSRSDARHGLQGGRCDGFITQGSVTRGPADPQLAGDASLAPNLPFHR